MKISMTKIETAILAAFVSLLLPRLRPRRVTYHWGGMKTAFTGAIAGTYRATSHMGAAGSLFSLSAIANVACHG